MQYYYLGSIGNIQMDRDTGSAVHQIRFDMGNYMNREGLEKARLELFQNTYPNLSEQELKLKMIEVDQVSRR